MFIWSVLESDGKELRLRVQFKVYCTHMGNKRGGLGLRHKEDRKEFENKIER